MTPEVFEQVQDWIKARRTSKRPRRRSDILLWPLQGKIVCPRCGRVMSTHDTHNGPVVYRHYRCRSHAGGRPPCKGLAFPAYEIEKIVASMLADPDLASSVPYLSPGHRLCLRRFQAAWDLLDLRAWVRLLPEIVDQVEYCESDSELRLHLNTEPLARILTNSKRSRKPDKRQTRGRCEPDGCDGPQRDAARLSDSLLSNPAWVDAPVRTAARKQPFAMGCRHIEL